MATIDIDIVIDTDTLVKAYPSPSKNASQPTGLPHNFMYMVAATSYVASGQATGDLTINALVGDTVRWRMESLAANSSVTAMIYDIRYWKGDQVTGRVDAVDAYPNEPVPTLVDGKNTNPPTFTAAKALDYYLGADITNTGSESYYVYFYATTIDRGTGKPVLFGYFYWDPTIAVKG